MSYLILQVRRMKLNEMILKVIPIPIEFASTSICESCF